MSEQISCKKDPENCEFVSLSSMVPEMLQVIRLQRATILGLLEIDGTNIDPDYTDIHFLKRRSDCLVHKLTQWAKKQIKENKQCPQHQKH